jgi:hypothetical protein
VPPAVAHIATTIPRWFERGDLHAWASTLAKCNYEHADKLQRGARRRRVRGRRPQYKMTVGHSS